MQEKKHRLPWRSLYQSLTPHKAKTHIAHMLLSFHVHVTIHLGLKVCRAIVPSPAGAESGSAGCDTHGNQLAGLKSV